MFSCKGYDITPIDVHMAAISIEEMFEARGGLALAPRGLRGRSKEAERHLAVLKSEKTRLTHTKEGYATQDAKSHSRMSLLPKHHDAIQWAYREVFGPYCGFAHSCLFVDRVQS